MTEAAIVTASATESDFTKRVRTFLDSRAERRTDAVATWGVGSESLALFHESSAEVERSEAQAARDWQRTRWEAGFGWITGPIAYGGAGLSAGHDRIYRMLEADYDVPDMNPLRIGLGTVSPAVVRFGSPDQIERFVAPMHRGDMVACQLFSEPEAGSDLAGVRTRAVRAPDGAWRLDGQKVWTSNATFADVGLALVRTDPNGPKHRSLTMFLVPMDSAGIEVRPLRQMTGGSSFSEVFLSGVSLSDDMRVGDEGTGWKVALGALAGERKAVGDRSHENNARALALLRSLMEQTGAVNDPVVRDRWISIRMNLEAARFQQRRMQMVDEATLTGAERAIDKLLFTTNLRLIGELAAEVLGQRFVADTGEWGTFGWNRWMMGALGYRIAGGTEEILKIMLAERILRLPRDSR
jgi:alkylation response protein AidB-like acyl-CoA dehydrogenase